MDIDIISNNEDITKAIQKIVDLKQPVDKNLEIIYSNEDKDLIGYKLDKYYSSQYMLVLNNETYSYFEDLDDLLQLADLIDYALIYK
jgi:hypothetical protein